MTQSLPPAGWYDDPATAEQQRYWSGSAWTDHTQPKTPPAPAPPVAAPPYAAPPQQAYAPASAYPPAQPAYGAAPQAYPPAQQQYGMVPQRQVQVRPYNQRMAARIAKRAKLNETAVAVAFTYNNLATMLIFGLAEDVVRLVPAVGELLEIGLSLISFYFHRIVLVTDRNVYVYRDWPFHIPGERLAGYGRGPGVVRIGSDSQGGWSRFIRRGELTFQDGLSVYHSPFWILRARYIAQEGNIPAGY
ncbi:MAG TPA: DUF2510 domain-containing protein [Mycobacteriales bacterium]|nr:DUF2510 domain-containing protein [Mycobacteriales bacterium]